MNNEKTLSDQEYSLVSNIITLDIELKEIRRKKSLFLIDYSENDFLRQISIEIVKDIEDFGNHMDSLNEDELTVQKIKMPARFVTEFMTDRYSRNDWLEDIGSWRLSIGSITTTCQKIVDDFVCYHSAPIEEQLKLTCLKFVLNLIQVSLKKNSINHID